MLARAVAALVLLALLPPVATAQESGEIRAQVRLPGPFAETLEVALTASGATWTQLPNGSIVEFDPGETRRYTMPIARPALAFAIIRAAEVVPLNVASIVLQSPEGWASVHSANVLAWGQGLRVESRLAGQARVRLATLGEPSPSDLAYVTRGVAYLSAQHERAPDDLLVIRAPANALGEGFVANATVVVTSDAPMDELARLVARAHQRYRVVEVAPTSAAWFREGEERLQEQMSLMAAGERTSAELDDTFTRARAVAEPDARLPQAPAGSTLARQKGLVVVRALDVELRNASGGRAGLADLLGALDGTRARVDSAAIEEAAVSLAGERVRSFFERYVYGMEWPATPGARDAADVFVRSLAAEPATVDMGDPVDVAYALVNRGTQPSELDLVLRVDGVAARTIPVRLDVGAAEEARASLTLATTGRRLVELGAWDATVHVRGPAMLRIVRAASAPDEPVSGEAFTLLVYVENRGETTGRARIELHEGDKLAQRTTEAFVDGGATATVTLPLRIDEPGLRAFEVRLMGEGVNETMAHIVNVRASEARETPLMTLLSLCAIVIAVALRSASRRLPKFPSPR